MICSVEDCPDRPLALSLCSKHYQRYKKYGDTLDRPRTGRPKGSGVTPLAERFWAFVDTSDPDGCWLWTGGTTTGGYGVIGRENRKQDGAHRVAYELEYGPIPPGQWVLHHCDNPPCVRADHLFLGTSKINQDDCVAKGRKRVGVNLGAKNGSAKLTDDQVRTIRERWSSGEKQNALAHEFGVYWGTIHNIVRNKTWRV